MPQGEVIRLGKTVSPAAAGLTEAVASCIQCGTCSGSCPTAPAMDYTPRQIMHMIQNGMLSEALNSRAIWLCATCYSCTVRCPRSIAVADILAQLRGLAIQQGIAEAPGMTFSKAFLSVIRRYGRMFEPELLIRYYLRKNPLKLVGLAPIGLQLLRKGKIVLLPEKLEPGAGGNEVRQIFAHTRRSVMKG